MYLSDGSLPVEIRARLSDELYRLLLGLGLFMTLVAGTAIYLGREMLVYYRYGPYAHWSAILIAAPLLAGLFIRWLRVPTPRLVLLISGCFAAVLVYPVYVDLWAEPPDLRLVGLYAALIIGVASLALIRVRLLFDILLLRWSQWRRNVRIRKTTGSRRPIRAPHEMLRYSRVSTRLAMLQLLMAVLSLLVSVVSILFLGQK